MPTMCVQASSISELNSCFSLKRRYEQTEQGSAKRVRFTENEPCVISHLPLCREIPEKEKLLTWYAQSEKESLRQEANADASCARKLDARLLLSGKGHLAFGETYQQVYRICNLYVAPDDDVVDVVSPEILTFLAMNQARGLEDRTAPRVAIERRLIRAQSIKLIVQNQVSKGTDVSLLAQQMSSAACKFAQALGVVDATAAMLVYTETEMATDEIEFPIQGAPLVAVKPNDLGLAILEPRYFAAASC
jgi:hypothetical protein